MNNKHNFFKLKCSLTDPNWNPTWLLAAPLCSSSMKYRPVIHGFDSNINKRQFQYRNQQLWLWNFEVLTNSSFLRWNFFFILNVRCNGDELERWNDLKLSKLLFGNSFFSLKTNQKWYGSRESSEHGSDMRLLGESSTCDELDHVILL